MEWNPGCGTQDYRTSSFQNPSLGSTRAEIVITVPHPIATVMADATTYCGNSKQHLTWRHRPRLQNGGTHTKLKQATGHLLQHRNETDRTGMELGHGAQWTIIAEQVLFNAPCFIGAQSELGLCSQSSLHHITKTLATIAYNITQTPSNRGHHTSGKYASITVSTCSGIRHPRN